MRSKQNNSASSTKVSSYFGTLEQYSDCGPPTDRKVEAHSKIKSQPFVHVFMGADQPTDDITCNHSKHNGRCIAQPERSPVYGEYDGIEKIVLRYFPFLPTTLLRSGLLAICGELRSGGMVFCISVSASQLLTGCKGF